MRHSAKAGAELTVTYIIPLHHLLLDPLNHAGFDIPADEPMLSVNTCSIFDAAHRSCIV